MIQKNILSEYFEDTVERGIPDFIASPRDENDAAEILKQCSRDKIPVTFCAAQTSMTGASVAKSGLLMSCKGMTGIVDIFESGGQAVALVKPGSVISDLQKEISKSGFFYPVSPTSKDECTIGGNVCTNATGEDSFKYGSVRRYVKSLHVIKANGEKIILQRLNGETPCFERSCGGYVLGWKNPIDLFIGSEGTLGFISEVGISLLEKEPEFFSAFLPFKTNGAALKFIVDIFQNKDVSLRALEFIDKFSIELMKTHPTFPKLKDTISSLVYLKVECRSKVESERALSKICSKDAIVAFTQAEKENMRLWRKHIPDRVKQLASTGKEGGGGKVGADWWVPMKNLLQMMDFFYSVARKTRLDHMAYAHLGRGHPHTNFFAFDEEQMKTAMSARLDCCRMAVHLGGGVSGEHGIGKINHHLLSIQHLPQTIEQMMAWKRGWDPDWILCPDNLFPACQNKG